MYTQPAAIGIGGAYCLAVPEHPDAALVRDALRALGRGDVEAMVQTLASDVEWHEIGRAEPVRGNEAVAALFGGPPLPDSEVTTEIHDVVANGDHVIALVRAEARRGTRRLDYRTAEMFHVRDGKITARWAFSDDTAASLAFYAN
jgi:ketosteroid isomerase-like protein